MSEPTSTLKDVMEFFNTPGYERVPLAEVKDLSEQDRLDLRRYLDEYRAAS